MTAVSALPGVWGTLQREAERRPLGRPIQAGREGERGPDVWARLKFLVDPAEFRPKVADDVELKEFHPRWGNDYAMIANPRDLVHYRLEPGEVELFKLMDGTRTVKEIVVERFRESGDLELAKVVELVHSLYVGNFLDRRFTDLDAKVKRALDPVSSARMKARTFARSLQIEWEGADRLVRWFYRNGVRVFFTKAGAALSVLVAVLGFAAFLYVVSTHRFALAGESLAFGVLILMALNYFLTFCHELGHAVVLTHYGRKVKSAGFMLYFGSPAFFVESADVLMLDRRQRVIQALGGPLAESIVAGTASLVVMLAPGWPFSHVLYQFAVLNYFVLFMNLVPLLELDGYFILSDLIQVPDLRPRSLEFVQHDLLHKLRKRERFSRQEVGLALYGILGIAFTIFTVYTAIYFWREIFGGLISRLWNGGLILRLVLVAMALVIAGPAVRGVLKLLRAWGRRLRAVYRRIRFKTEVRWRVEAANMIDALPIFGDVPVEVLNDLAGRVRIRSLAPGQPLVRQGDYADAFYVVRRGQVQVVEEDPETGNERVLSTLGRGDSFGELALVRGSRRTATVRAVGQVEVFEVDKATFDRLLADMVSVPQFAPTLQQAAELQALPAFAHLGPREIAELLEVGQWTNLPPGAVLMRQGEPGDAFYAIGSGQVEIERDGEVVATRRAGGYVGEVALLMDVPRTATVRARTPLRVFRLDREGFDRLVAGSFRSGTLEPTVAIGRVQEH